MNTNDAINNLEKIKVPFYHKKILTIKGQDFVVVPIKPLCSNMELSWSGQRRLILNDEVLTSVVVMATATGADGKKYKMFCLPIGYLNGWLFRIPSKRYSGKKKEIIIQYQRDCYNTIQNYYQSKEQS